MVLVTLNGIVKDPKKLLNDIWRDRIPVDSHIVVINDDNGDYVGATKLETGSYAVETGQERGMGRRFMMNRRLPAGELIKFLESRIYRENAMNGGAAKKRKQTRKSYRKSHRKGTRKSSHRK